MSKVVRVQGGDYKVVVGSSVTPGNIILDTNPAGALGSQGEVRITGDLVVMGNTTVVESETLSVKDNIIEINKGETGEGVSTLGSTAGIRIDRGTEPYVELVWDENLLSRDPDTNINLPGTFKFTTSSNELIPIATNSINTFGGNLALISTGAGIITVTGTADYEQRILNYSKLNSLFEIISVRRQSGIATIEVNTLHELQNGDRIEVVCFPDATFNSEAAPVTIINSTTVTYASPGPNVLTTNFPLGIGGTVRPSAVFDDDRIPNMKAIVDYTKSSLTTFVPKKIQEQDTKVEAFDTGISGLSEITFVVDSSQRAVINNTGLSVDNINIFGNNISNFLNDNIRVDSVLSLENKATDPIATLGYVTVYSKSEPGTGGTGIYFVNTTGTDDELISKTKSLLYSLIL
jgi:hypothetical protein